MATPYSPPHRPDRRARMDVLFTAYATDVYAFALRRTTRAAAEDVVSETFLVAWRRLESVPDAAKPWLLAVARRVLANQRRSDGRQSALRLRLKTTEPDHGDTPATRQRCGEAVLVALEALSPIERDAVTLIAWDDLTAEEAATVLGCSRATFYVRLHRARRQLAAALATTTECNDEQEADQHGPH